MLTSSKCHLAKFCKVDFRRFILGEKQAFPVGFSNAFPRFLRISKTRLNTSLNYPLKVINVRSVGNNTNLVLFSLSIFLTFFAIAFLESVKPEPYKEESQKPILVILGLSGSLERIAKTIWKAFSIFTQAAWFSTGTMAQEGQNSTKKVHFWHFFTSWPPGLDQKAIQKFQYFQLQVPGIPCQIW